MTVNILGTDYTVETLSKAEDSYLNNCKGYCDHTSKRIVVREKDEDDDVDDYEYFKKKIMRHEIIHAFMHESGLGECWEHRNSGHEETVVDWIAKQFPKMLKAFQDAGCIAELKNQDAGCARCEGVFFTPKPFEVKTLHDGTVEVVFNYCPVCGKKLPKQDEG